MRWVVNLFSNLLPSKQKQKRPQDIRREFQDRIDAGENINLEELRHVPENHLPESLAERRRRYEI
ncbi:MAG: hypothetical protein ACF788_01380, partial [Novipirellula sp. JB048]